MIKKGKGSWLKFDRGATEAILSWEKECHFPVLFASQHQFKKP